MDAIGRVFSPAPFNPILKRTTLADARADAFRDTLLASGSCGQLIAARDWSQTSLGPIDAWPQSLRTATSTLLRSPVPMVMLWGEDGIMLYNVAYSVFAAGRHPELVGSKVREGWPEVAAFNDNVMRVGLSSGTLSYKDQELTLHRHGHPVERLGERSELDTAPVEVDNGPYGFEPVRPTRSSFQATSVQPGGKRLVEAGTAQRRPTGAILEHLDAAGRLQNV